VTTPTRCPTCQSPDLRWTTVRRSVPVDVLQCQGCGARLAEEDWMPPLAPLLPGRCVNCGDRQDYDVCIGCGLTAAEEVEVHDELRRMVTADDSLLGAARTALAQGRSLLSLKLATASAAYDAADSEAARALRVWLLARLADPATAIDDAKAWVDSADEPSALALATLGRQLEADFPGPAADAYERALRRNRNQPLVRARRARLLLSMSREGQAYEELGRVFETPTLDPPALEAALPVSEALCELFERQQRDDEVRRLLERVGAHSEQSAALLAQRARLAALAGDLNSARADLKKAKRLQPEHPIYERVDALLQPAQKSWWRW
jgi:tetratricopeptide (TPR) repeat protein